MNLKECDAIIFDLDGTLWDATKNIRKSWNELLEKDTEVNREAISEKELEECMGMPMYDIAAKLFPLETEKTQKSIMDKMCVYENEYLEKNGGELFDGLKSTLEKLSKRYDLYIVSNCQDGYIETFLKAHNTESFFKDIESWGRTKCSKSENNKMIVKRNNIKNPVYVGDTKGDAVAAKEAGIPFIFAAYGFGDVDEKDYLFKIDDIRELTKLFGVEA